MWDVLRFFFLHWFLTSLHRKSAWELIGPKITLCTKTPNRLMVAMGSLCSQVYFFFLRRKHGAGKVLRRLRWIGSDDHVLREIVLVGTVKRVALLGIDFNPTGFLRAASLAHRVSVSIREFSS
jgi:hypothetical protein